MSHTINLKNWHRSFDLVPRPQKIFKKWKNESQVIQSISVINVNMIGPFLTSLGCREVLTQNCNKQSHKKTEKHEMPLYTISILISYETMIRNLTLTEFASAAIITGYRYNQSIWILDRSQQKSSCFTLRKKS